jgi:hypothetical protein
MHERAHIRTSLTERCTRVEQSDETYEGGTLVPCFPYVSLPSRPVTPRLPIAPPSS